MSVAENVQIGPGAGTAKVRSVWTVAILTVVTLGMLVNGFKASRRPSGSRVGRRSSTAGSPSSSWSSANAYLRSGLNGAWSSLGDEPA